MEIVLFSKFFERLSVEGLGEKASELGYDGIDVAVRPGHPIHSGNAVEVLPRAVASASQARSMTKSKISFRSATNTLTRKSLKIFPSLYVCTVWFPM